MNNIFLNPEKLTMNEKYDIKGVSCPSVLFPCLALYYPLSFSRG